LHLEQSVDLHEAADDGVCANVCVHSFLPTRRLARKCVARAISAAASRTVCSMAPAASCAISGENDDSCADEQSFFSPLIPALDGAADRTTRAA